MIHGQAASLSGHRILFTQISQEGNSQHTHHPKRLESSQSVTIKRVLSWQITQVMKKQNLSKAAS
jgi:hypothetical protein